MTKEATQPPDCGVCGQKKVKVKLPKTTKHQGFEVWVCPNKKPGQRLPCDGYPPVLANPNK